MAAFVCRMCGGALSLIDGRRICECGYCGTVQSVPLLDGEEKAEGCRNAERLRREHRYDKAAELCEGLIRLSPTDADLYWALVLCRYGVYFSDGEPILERTRARSLLSDEDFKTALRYADEEQRSVMERQAARIDEIRRSIVERSLKEQSDEIFLVCAESDGLAVRIASELTARLSAEYRVFFPITQRAQPELEPRIFAALSSVRVMIVIGTSAESFEDVRTRNAWSRFLTSGKPIIPACRGMDAGGLPRELSGFQAADMSRLGWESDLLASLDKIFGRRSDSRKQRNADPVLRRAYISLEAEDFPDAERICARLLENDPNSAEAYLIKLLAEYGLRSEEELDALKEDFSRSENYRMAMQLGSEGFRIRLREHNSRSLYAKCAELVNAAETEKDYRAAAAEFRALNGFADSAERTAIAEKRADELHAESEEKRREGMYALSEKALRESTETAVLISAQKSLAALGDYKDSVRLAKECAEKIELLSARSAADESAEQPEKHGVIAKIRSILRRG